MKWSDIPFQPNTRALRQFAAGCLIFFTAIGAAQYLMHGRHVLGSALLILGLTLGLLGLIRPLLVKPIFVGWMVLAFPIGWVISQCMMLIMFYIVLTPVALFLRIKRRDQLGLLPDDRRSSLWSPVQPTKDVSSYFRQY